MLTGIEKLNIPALVVIFLSPEVNINPRTRSVVEEFATPVSSPKKLIVSVQTIPKDPENETFFFFFFFFGKKKN